MLEMLGLGILLEFQDKASEKMLKTNKIFNQMYDTSEKLTEAIQGNIEVFQKLGATALEIGAIGKAFMNTGKSIMTALSKSTKEAETFETEMQQLKFVTNATAEEFENFKKVAIDTGIATAFSPQEATKAMYELKSAGLSNVAMLEALNATLDMVAISAGKIDLASGASLMANTLNKFNLEATEQSTAHIADVFAEATKLTNFHMEDFPAFINSLGSAPSKVNLPLEEFVALGGLLRNVGQQSAESGHTVAGFTRQILMLTRSLERGKTTALSGQKLDMLEEMGITQESLWNAEGKLKSMTEIFAEFVKGSANMTEQAKAVAFQTIFGDQASNMMYAVENATKAFMSYDDATGQYIETAEGGKQTLDDLVAQLTNVGDSAAQGADEMLKTTWGIKKLWEGSVQTFNVLLGQTLLPFIGAFLQGLTSMLNKVIEFTYAHPKITKVLGMGIGLAGLLITVGGVILTTVALIMGMISAVGLVTSKIQLFATGLGLAKGGMLSLSSVMTFLHGKLLALLVPFAKIALLTGALYVAWKYDFLGIKSIVTDFYKNTKNAFLDSRDIVSMSVNDMMKHLSSLENEDDFFSSLTVALVDFQLIWLGLVDAFNDNTLSDENFAKLKERGLLPIIEGVLELKFRFEALWDGITTGFSNVMEWSRKFKLTLEGLGFSIDPLLDGLKNVLGLSDDMGDIESWNKIGEVIGVVGTVLGALWLVVKVVGIVVGIGSKIWGAITLVAGGIGTIISAVGTVIGWVGGLFSTIFGFVSTLVSGVISFGSTIMSVVGTALGAIAAFLGIPVWVAGLVVAAVVAVIAGLVWLWNEWEWFRDAVCMVFQVIFQNVCAMFMGMLEYGANIVGGIIDVFGGIIDFVVGVFTGNWEKAWQGVVQVFTSIISTIVDIFRIPINTIIGMINNVINGINSIGFTFPDWDWIPDKYQNQSIGINIPNIPKLSTGGYIQSEGISYLHPNEVVVNSDLTDKLREFLNNDIEMPTFDANVNKSYSYNVGTTANVEPNVSPIDIPVNAMVDIPTIKDMYGTVAYKNEQNALDVSPINSSIMYESFKDDVNVEPIESIVSYANQLEVPSVNELNSSVLYESFKDELSVSPIESMVLYANQLDMPNVEPLNSSIGYENKYEDLVVNDKQSYVYYDTISSGLDVSPINESVYYNNVLDGVNLEPLNNVVSYTNQLEVPNVETVYGKALYDNYISEPTVDGVKSVIEYDGISNPVNVEDLNGRIAYSNIMSVPTIDTLESSAIYNGKVFEPMVEPINSAISYDVNAINPEVATPVATADVVNPTVSPMVDIPEINTEFEYQSNTSKVLDSITIVFERIKNGFVEAVEFIKGKVDNMGYQEIDANVLSNRTFMDEYFVTSNEDEETEDKPVVKGGDGDNIIIYDDGDDGDNISSTDTVNNDNSVMNSISKDSKKIEVQNDNSIVFEEGAIQVHATGKLDYDVKQLFDEFIKKYEREKKIQRALVFED